jgi:hypothetical protein
MHKHRRLSMTVLLNAHNEEIDSGVSFFSSSSQDGHVMQVSGSSHLSEITVVY